MSEAQQSRQQIATENRNFQINGIKERMKMVFNEGREVDKQKLVAYCIMDMGLTKRMAVEYINAAKVILNADEKNGVIFVEGKVKENKKIDLTYYGE